MAAVRARKPDGFPHDEDPSIRVCTVCRRLPLRGAAGAPETEPPREEDQLDVAFLAGIKEELASIEENEKNIQALSQVFRYYAKHARQLSQALIDWAMQCFPWELIHAMHLVDDILLMDNTGRFKAELAERMQAVAVKAFRKAPSDHERREVLRMLHAWQELKIFDLGVLEAIRATLRAGGDAACRILDEVVVADEDEEDVVGVEEPTAAAPDTAPTQKRRKLEQKVPAPRDGQEVAPVATARKTSEKIQAVVDRILSIPADKPFEMLGIAEDGANGHDIRKAYRRIALLIHPDKNPGMEAGCQEALIKLQNGREQAESDLQRLDTPCIDGARGETRSAATAAAANATIDSGFKCKYPGCDLPPCKQCANQCCTRNITHCHMIARAKAGMQCFFHPPPRAWARNA